MAPSRDLRPPLRVALVILIPLWLAARWRRRLRRYEIVEPSMEPALRPGDYVVATHHSDPPARGDIVVFPHPRHADFELVKRVVALPGETVVIADGRVFVDGASLPEPWAHGTTKPAGSWSLRNEIFVLGDQRERSDADSRSIGPLPITRAVWRVALRYWPPRRAGLPM